VTPQEDGQAAYRPGVGILLVNRAGKVFVGRRVDMPAGLPAWQMPQGGIDSGETPRQAALRELKEETGTDKAVILAESRIWHHYDLPPDIADRIWSGRYRGQRQKWFALRYIGKNIDIDINKSRHPEFDAWKWAEPGLLAELIVPFKRQIYLEVLAEFRDCLAPSGG